LASRWGCIDRTLDAPLGFVWPLKKEKDMSKSAMTLGEIADAVARMAMERIVGEATQEENWKQQEEIGETLRTMMDRGVDKHDAWKLVEFIKGLAVIAIREELSRERNTSDKNS
jgi:hypothetical protein